MFSQVCVKNSVHRGKVCIPACTGGYISQHALGWCLSRGCLPPSGTRGRHPPGLEADPPKTATAADGTHPTGFLDGVSIKEEEKGIIVKEKALPFKKRHSLSIK